MFFSISCILIYSYTTMQFISNMYSGKGVKRCSHNP